MLSYLHFLFGRNRNLFFLQCSKVYLLPSPHR
nr:MAG TPA: hypothetical protein [Caudoviricetes sp.]